MYSCVYTVYVQTALYPRLKSSVQQRFLWLGALLRLGFKVLSDSILTILSSILQHLAMQSDALKQGVGGDSAQQSCR